MSGLRLAARLVALALLCSGAYLLILAGDPFARTVDRARGNGRRGAGWRGAGFSCWARGVAAIIGMRAEVHGEPPRPPFFLVSNHLSYVDVIALAARMRCVFVAKSDVRDWPVIGRFCRSVDTLFIDRRNKRDIPRVMRSIDEVLRGGRGVVVFPEGTSTSGSGVMPFRPSLLEAAARASIPVSYACISYSTPPGNVPAHESVCWWGDMTFGPHLFGLLRLPGFAARLTFGEEPIVEGDRKVLASRLRLAVERRFQPVV